LSIRVVARYLPRPIGPRPRRRRCSAHLLLGGKATGEFVEDEVGVDRCHASYQNNEHPFHLFVPFASGRILAFTRRISGHRG
jgi:hypothetical protein